jgi:hypothetical protein
LLFRLQEKRRGLRGRRKWTSARVRGREGLTTTEADVTYLGRDLVESMIVTSTVSATVTGGGPMSMQAEGQTIEAVPTTTGEITKGRGTETVGMVMQEGTWGE